MTFDGKAFGQEIVGVVKSYVADMLGPINARLDAIERRLDSLQLPDIPALVKEEVTAAVSALPPPEKGEKGDKGDPGEPGRDGRDGLDVKDLFRAEGGHLIAVLSDGTTKDLGKFVGEDGKDGAPGADGIGFDDMAHEIREDGVYLVWEKGEVAKEAYLPVPFYRGVWSKDAAYRIGNAVTWGGSTWIATKDAPAGKPDTPDSDWVLSTKRGQNGKDYTP